MPPAWSTGAGVNTASRWICSSRSPQRWSLTLGTKVSPAQVVLCLIDLKLARLARDPKHLDSQVDVAGYAAVLREVSR